MRTPGAMQLSSTAHLAGVAMAAGSRRPCSPSREHPSVCARSSPRPTGVTPPSRPIFTVPAVVIAVIAACVFVHLARVYVLSDDEDIDFLVTFAFIPARYSSASVLGELPGGWGA